MPWSISGGTLHIPWAFLTSDVLSRFSRHEPLLLERGLVQEGAFRATWEEWARLGALPETDEEEYYADWRTLQDALAEALEIDLQVVAVRSVGFVGAGGANVVMSVDSVDLPAADPFSTGWHGAPPLPAVAQAHRLLLGSPGRTRQEQIARWARVRAHLEKAGTLLAPGLAVQFDDHLEHLKVRTP